MWADPTLVEERDLAICSSAKAFQGVDVVVGALLLDMQGREGNSAGDLSRYLSLHLHHIDCRLPPLRDDWDPKLRVGSSGHVVWKGCRQLRHEVEMMSSSRVT